MPSREKLRQRRNKAENNRGEYNSLFGEILDWMLAPLMFVWPISIAIIHNVADDIAHAPYDKVLGDSVYELSRQIRYTPVGAIFVKPPQMRDLFHIDGEDIIYYQVLGGAGELLAGDGEIPGVPDDKPWKPGEMYYRGGRINNEDVRVAYMFQPVTTIPGSYVTVQVAETLNKREALTSRILSGVLLPQFVIIPIAVVLVYFGLARGLWPLKRLQEMIEKRRPTDLAPIDVRRVPEELRPLINALNDMMLRLELNLVAQQRFIADAAHQMRTPLTGLRSQAELALLEDDPAQIRACMEQILVSSTGAAHLINQLLALARAEASTETVHAVERIELNSLLENLIADWVPAARLRRIDFGFERAHVPLHVDANPVLLNEMFKNLIDNAIKYTPRGGVVTVRLRADIRAIFEVEDSGPGIPPEDRQRVFERFYRVLGTQVEGSGLGLPIVSEIAELHRAVVELLDPREGSGLIVRVSFPRVIERADDDRQMTVRWDTA
ncbi:MAG: sensor histidine kinase N-terminal domain-containing protein [Gammaproteobacteria bacterium]|jgi:two-component system, OmpR family, sensor histidine kinase TctE|nr:sensor histidine kinase N-terminal domain-containing protein [Gammaproteobacteria bacterium]MBU0770611.1 sensor histidine kinase N-terminal domain-containing protein [Gammaproteobacteria bacterium]MBU0856183.1 sensor histidine kinase N-terminal domain-containing protein [Gammaproteobacteria bacterium]MBU1845630.1 sensor histidine kinase N-terminal domain-containing protein [Gammaproteobacteria bacterium]